jgi:uncharacterized protein
MTPPPHSLRLIVEPGRFAIARFARGAQIPFEFSRGFSSLTQTEDELSLVCAEELIPESVRAERGRALLRVAGTLDFGLTGVMASLAVPLAAAEVSIFTVSTFDTDYLLIKSEDLPRAITSLEKAGHTVQRSTPA